jgi:uncharacterized protein YndB with AHSA1/START domain
MTQSDETKTLTIEREMPHAPEKIWRALTQPALIAEWLMKNDFQPVVGHKFKLRADPVPQWDGIIDCEVLIVEPERKLSYTWDTLGIQTRVLWTLVATPAGTLVRMEHSGFRHEANYRGAQYGWKGFLDGLEATLAKQA